MHAIRSKYHIATYLGFFLLALQISVFQHHGHESCHEVEGPKFEEVCDLCSQWANSAFEWNPTLFSSPEFFTTSEANNVEQEVVHSFLIFPSLRGPPALA